MQDAYICDYIRTPIGRFGGTLATVRADDLGGGATTDVNGTQSGCGLGRCG